jgi:hypothetical protein
VDRTCRTSGEACHGANEAAERASCGLLTRLGGSNPGNKQSIKDQQAHGTATLVRGRCADVDPCMPRRERGRREVSCALLIGLSGIKPFVIERETASSVPNSISHASSATTSSRTRDVEM